MIAEKYKNSVINFVGFIEKYGKYMLVIFFIVCLVILQINVQRKNLNYDFNGIVQNVTYDIKRCPTVTINGTNYSLGGRNWGFYKDTIETGDKMIKKKGSMDLYLIKPYKKDTINFLDK